MYYWDIDTNMVNNYSNVQFDEGTDDIEKPNPNDRQLLISLGRPLTEYQE